MIRLFTLGLCAAVNAVDAAQMHSLDEERELRVNVSNTELNRIIVEKDRISDVFAHGAKLEVVSDERLGQIFVKVTSFSQESVRLTLTTEEGRVQDMRLLNQDIQGQTVILRESPERKTEENERHEQQTVVGILSQFLSGALPAGFRLSGSSENYQSFFSEDYIVENFIHHNTSDALVCLDEEMFVRASQTHAISIECPVLEPGEFTSIWRISTHDE